MQVKERKVEPQSVDEAIGGLCPVRDVLDRLSDRWTVLVLRELVSGTSRFSELKRRVDGISPRMLSQTLRHLEQDGLVTREVFPTVPLRVQYTITPLGHSYYGVVREMIGWAIANQDEVLAARAAYVPPEGYDAK